MRLLHCPALILAFSLAFAAPAFADPYFKASTIPPTLIDPPLVVNSAEWKQDIEQIIALQKHVDTNEIEQAKREKDMQPELVADKFERVSHPALYAMLDRVSSTSKAVVGETKAFWHTKRPYVMDKRIQTPIGGIDNAAYPSGHTAGSYVWAYVLGLLIPEEREYFIARAEKISQHRVLMGIHYPHDIRGGKQLALLIMGSLMQNAEFQADLEQARKELHSVH